MIKVRKNCFETNSSSTHSLVMAVKDDFDKWVDGKLVYCAFNVRGNGNIIFESGKLYPLEEVEAWYKAKGEDWKDSYNFEDYEDFCNDELEYEEYSYNTPNGEVIKAIAKFGYDG